jgi:hypothetical protein
MKTTANPLSVNFGFLGNHREIIPGSNPELYISIKNRGERCAVIDLMVEATHKDSSVINQWVTPRRIRLALNGEESKTVSLQIQIPENAWPQDYHYDVVLDSPEHYPEYTPLHYPQILKVLPTPTTPQHGGEDPIFFLSPVTNSGQPKQIKPGETFEVNVQVENRTPLVDRFHLICSDLQPDYFSVYYPEIRDQYGLIVNSDGLELNPGQQGEIKLDFHPPHNAPAGNYYPTIRLASVNNPRLSLLDIVYLYVPPSYDLALEIETFKDRIKDPKVETGEYLVNIINQGNVERSLVLKGRNCAWGSLLFTLQPDFATIAPGSKAQASMLVKPRGRWWNRPFFGVGRDFRFSVDLEDMRNQPVPGDLPQSKVTWEPYPKKWLIFFIILLSLLGISGAIALAILIWNLFLKQPPSPEVVELSPVKTLFKEADDEVIQLNWNIRNAKNIDRLVLIQQGGSFNETKTFSFQDGLPVDLSVRNPTQTNNYCNFQTVKKETNLVCRGIITSARKPGQYQFELQVFNQKNAQKPVNVLKTDTIRVLPAGFPKISELFSARTEYLINKDSQDSPVAPVFINWEITNANQIAEMQLVGLAQDGTVAAPSQKISLPDGQLPKSLQAFCKIGDNRLSCANFPVNIRKAGLYTFRLTVDPKHGAEEKAIVKVTEVIRVKAVPTAKSPNGTQSSKFPNGTQSNNAQIPGMPSQSGQNNPSQFKAEDKPGELIDPSLWPSQPGNGAPVSPPSTYNSYQHSRPAISAARQGSIQQANDLSRGLLIAQNAGEIKLNSSQWRQVQDAIQLLRGGQSLPGASQRSGVSEGKLNQLIAWGQGRGVPQGNTAPSKVSAPSKASAPSESGNFSKPPEPLWGKPENPTDTNSKTYSKPPLW